MEAEAAGMESPHAADGLSRRRVMSGLGVAVAGGLVATVAGVTPAEATGGPSVASGPSGTTVFEFVCRLVQADLDFTGFGYLTQIANVADADLFTDPAHRDEAHARYLARAKGSLRARSIDDPVHTLDIHGSLNIYYREGAGASWSDQDSFARGTRLASYTLNLQDVLTVIAPLTGLPVLNGQARQNEANNIKGQQFGRKGQSLRFMATGFGKRSDPPPSTAPQALLQVGGSMVAT